MDTHDILSVISIVVGLAAGAMGLRKHDVKKHQAKLEARTELGRRYAQMALTQTAATPADLRRRAMLDAFRIIDTTLDGRRDFSEAQAGVFVDEALKK